LHAQEAERAGTLPYFTRHNAIFLPRIVVGQHLGLQKVAKGVAEHEVRVVE
jgi:hypothetical protein